MTNTYLTYDDLAEATSWMADCLLAAQNENRSLSQKLAALLGGKIVFHSESGKGSSLSTRESFGDIQLHLEFATPTKVEGTSQGRGNSGVRFMDRYEIQVLDSYDNRTYADGMAAAIYGDTPPLVNVARKPGEWQTYDIVFEAPRFKGPQLISPAYVTVFWNGVLVHNRRIVNGPTSPLTVHQYIAHDPELPLVIQNHGNPVRFRNVWVRRLKGYDQGSH